MTSSLRLLFAGTPAFASHHLQSIAKSSHRVLGVLTQPDRNAGRGQKLIRSRVKEDALKIGIPVFQPESLSSSEIVDEISDLEIDAMVVVAYGLILPKKILQMPRLGCINVHASLLPKWRGAAPVQRAIEAGDKETGISIMLMEEGLDTGPILLRRSVTIKPMHTSRDLLCELSSIGCLALTETLDQLEYSISQQSSQKNSAATYAHKIDKTEALINWHLSADEIARRIRAFNPFPGCYTKLGDDRLKIWSATAEKKDSGGKPGEIISATANGLKIACGEGTLSIQELQIAGGKSLPIENFLHGKGTKLSPGKILQSKF